MAVLEPDTGNRVPTAPSRQARGFVHLKTRADFLRVAKGARSHTAAFSLQAAAAERPTAAARFGLTVTKKTAGAVQRNRIRRRLREAVRAACVAAKPGHDYVLVARQEALVIPFTQLIADLVRALESVHARRGGRRRTAPMPVRTVDLAAVDGANGQDQRGPDQPGPLHRGQAQPGKDQ